MSAQFLLVVMAGMVSAGQVDKEPPKLPAEITSHENRVWAAWLTQDADALLGLLAGEYREIGGLMGALMTRPEALKNLSSLRIHENQRDNIVVLPLGRGAALVTYRVRVKGSFKGQDFSPERSYVSAVWVNRGEKWLSLYRQWTPLVEQEPPPPTIEAVEIALTPKGLRYVYNGATKLEDVRVSITLIFPNARVPHIDKYWGTWLPGEVKEIDLGFLARNVNEIERIELTGSALLNGRKVLLALTSRREGK